LLYSALHMQIMLDMLIIQLYRDLDNNIVKSSDDVNNQAAKICIIT